MQDHLFHRKDLNKKNLPFPVATLGNCLTESSKRSLTFMEQMFPCGMMSHESRRMWEREEGMRKKRELREEEELRGRARRRKPRRHTRANWMDEWMREPGNWMNEIKINCPPLDYEPLEISAGQIWQLFNTSRQHSNIYADFPELYGHNSEPIIRILILVPSSIW